MLRTACPETAGAETGVEEQKTGGLEKESIALGGVGVVQFLENR